MVILTDPFDHRIDEELDPSVPDYSIEVREKIIVEQVGEEIKKQLLGQILITANRSRAVNSMHRVSLNSNWDDSSYVMKRINRVSESHIRQVNSLQYE